MKKNLTLSMLVASNFFLSVSPRVVQAQPFMVENGIAGSEAVRIIGSNTWLSFYNESLYDGFLWNNLGNIALGTSYINTSGRLVFYTYGLERMNIDAAGNVSIGAQDGSSGRLRVFSNDFRLFDPTIFGHSVNSDGVLGVSNSGIGTVGRSSSSTGVVGSGRVGVSGEGTVVGVSASGENSDFNAVGPGIDYSSTSSRRWKTNIHNIDEPLKKIAALRGVYYTWDEDHGGQKDVGFIAEEVGEILPEIVAYEENGMDAKGLDYSKMTPLLVEAFNALKREHETLKAEHQKTLERISRLEKMIPATSSSH